ncbi:MAG: hypothetical protein NXY57DRAFT_1044404, partial [Lentinula lateritia]
MGYIQEKRRGRSVEAFSKTHRRVSVELQMDYVNVIFAHRPDPTVLMEEIFRPFDYEIEKGWVLYWVTSEWPAWEIEDAFQTWGRDKCVVVFCKWDSYRKAEGREKIRKVKELGCVVKVMEKIEDILGNKPSGSFTEDSSLYVNLPTLPSSYLLSVLHQYEDIDHSLSRYIVEILVTAEVKVFTVINPSNSPGLAHSQPPANYQACIPSLVDAAYLALFNKYGNSVRELFGETGMVALNPSAVPDSGYFTLSDLIVTVNKDYNIFNPSTPIEKQIVILYNAPNNLDFSETIVDEISAIANIKACFIMPSLKDTEYTSVPDSLFQLLGSLI